ncbi:hypothetical protein ElyMa_002668000 [Elysia marginata]|uniref:Protein CUSTOS n=1 Tax=Elysia marginata TaxID=1093978 RepID=A0AAV4H9L5_9GAST|nr:hypothetical protein ElyMa_002668000 [Elysia marginata]
MKKSKTGTQSPSSSESSDDEEEQRKIREAVLGVGTSAYQRSESESKTQTDPHSTSLKEAKKIDLKASCVNGKIHRDVTALKSNRPRDRNDDDHEPLLKTTPEFRAYVAKQLSKLLDRDLCESISQSVWEKSHVKDNHKSHGGVKLFSDSQGWFELKPKEDGKEAFSKATAEPKKRKIRLSTSSSSDSSVDEDIKACVYSVADIEQENLRLSRLEEKPAKQNPTANNLQVPKSDGAPYNDRIKVEKIEKEKSKTKKKKKKKKKQSESETN